MVDSSMVTETSKSKSNEAESQGNTETAATIAGFGWYNVMLLVTAIPGAMSLVFKTSVMSYVVPIAECDLKLTLLDKGLLNAITYAGMISGGFFWGYLSDRKGRKNILILGFALDAICVFCEALSQNLLQLEITKFIGGFIICGPFAVLMTYMTEMHAKKYRPKVLFAIGMMLCVGTLALPFMALLTLTSHIEIFILGLTVHNWNCFIALSAVPNVIAVFGLLFFPESPKFLMSQGKPDKALKVFQTIYSINHRRPQKDFPIKKLLIDNPAKQTKDPESGIEKDSGSSLSGLKQFRPLFTKPYLSISLLVCAANFCILLSQNSIRLWLPQLFASIDEYNKLFPHLPTHMCAVIEYSVGKSEIMSSNYNNTAKACISIVSFDAYLNNMYVSLAGLLGFLFAGSLVNLLGRKILLLATLFMAMICNMGLYLSISSLMTLILSSVAVACGSLACTSIIDIASSSVPTSVRAMIISIAMMIGRMGALSGNVIFPLVMKISCAAPFTINALLFLAGFIFTLVMPKDSKKPLT